MSKGKKIAIVVIPIIGFIAILMIWGSQPYVNHNVSEIAGIKSFVVLHDEGNLYSARFSLIDNDNHAAATNVHISYKVCNIIGSRDVPASEFTTHQLQLTGQEFIAASWLINEPDMKCGNFDKAHLMVSLSDYRVFHADETVFS